MLYCENKNCWERFGFGSRVYQPCYHGKKIEHRDELEGSKTGAKCGA